MRRSVRRTLLTLAALAPAVALPTSATRAEDAESGQQTAQTFERSIPVKLDYLLYLPADYGKDASKKFPVILFLHGAGERGAEVNKVKLHGPPKLLAQEKDSPVKQFVVISPQCPPDRWWQPDELIALLDDVMKSHPQADPDRVYLTGLSMGGFGTWDTAIRNPRRFAAIAPICGGGERQRVRAIRDVPTWVFHGEKDPTVPIARSEEMVEALKKAGCDPKFTRYPEAGHDSWTETYNNPELYKWFLQHKRGEKAGSADAGNK